LGGAHGPLPGELKATAWAQYRASAQDRPAFLPIPASIASEDSQHREYEGDFPVGVKRNAILGLITIAAFVGCGLLANAEAQEAPDSLIDYDGFVGLSGELSAYRQSRLADLETFNTMKAEPGTILLDTRSAAAFAMGHIDGAVNLNFSDFTAEKLATVLGDKDTRILIYCNNNFTDNEAPVMLKSIQLALNVPTFINLYGYGYENIYELKGAHSIRDADIHWVSDWPEMVNATTVQEN
jgi:phage shock protein E